MPKISKKAIKPSLNYILVGLLVVASFVIGSLYTKVKSLEGSKNTGAGGGGPAAVSPAPRAELTVSDSDPSLGSKDAKVTVVIFEDFQCPFCGAFSGLNKDMVGRMQQRDPSWQPPLSNLKKDYVDTNKVRLVWKDYPFLGQESTWSAQAARCAQEQGKFWEFHDYLFSHQNGENQGAFSKENLKKFAADMGLKTGDFNTCLDNDKYAEQMKQAMTYGQGVGVSGTPATFINDKLISGAVPYTQLKTAVDEALAAAK